MGRIGCFNLQHAETARERDNEDDSQQLGKCERQYNHQLCGLEQARRGNGQRVQSRRMWRNDELGGGENVLEDDDHQVGIQESTANNV